MNDQNNEAENSNPQEKDQMSLGIDSNKNKYTNHNNKDTNEETPNDNEEELLANSRVNITFDRVNNSMMSRESYQSYQSVPFKENKLDLDLPNFSPTKFETNTWKVTHSISFFLYSAILATSTWFFIQNQKKVYHISLTIANLFFVVASFVEWNRFKRGCIGYSNLNSCVKDNIDNSIKAKILRSEYGVKYFISVVGACMFLLGNIYYFVKYPEIFFGNEKSKNKHILIGDAVFVDFNFVGMVIISLAQILKIEKMMTENKINDIKNDLIGCLIEILLFFASLFFGTSYLLQRFYVNINEPSIFLSYSIMKHAGNLLYIVSALLLQYRYYLSTYEDLNAEEDFKKIKI